MFSLGITDHLEGPFERPSNEIFDEVADLVRLADELGVEYAWFAEHHAHQHHGHLPTPLLYALHLAGQTSRIKLGTAIVCLNLHDSLDMAEQVAVADALARGRMAPGFGSGSTPDEVRLFGLEETDEAERHRRFERSLREIVHVWRSADSGTSRPLLPRVADDLPRRCWVAVNSAGSARIAGALGFGMLFSHLRTPAQYREYIEAYRQAGGRGLVAANRPIYVGPDDAAARRTAGPALRTLWRRFQFEGKIAREIPEPESVEELSAHPINFIIGGPESVGRQLRTLHGEVPFDVANVEVRWTGLSHAQVRESLSRLVREVLPRIRPAAG